MTLRVSERERIIQQEHARQEGWSRWAKPSRFIVFLLILVGLVVGVWFLVHESEEPVEPGSLRLIRAEEEPYKVKVDEQEILSVRHQDKLVYSRIHRGEKLPQVEHLMPEPEAPIVLGEGNPEVQVIVETVGDSDPIGFLIRQEEGQVGDTGFTVRVATMDSKDQAQQEWKRLQGKHEKLLRGKSPIIRQVDLGKRGIKYTLEVGTFSSGADADTVAKALKGVKVRGTNVAS